MRARSFTLHVRLVPLVGLALLCACINDPNISVPAASASIEWVDQEGRVVHGRDASYDFGSVFMGRSSSRTMVIHNTGRSGLVLESLTVSGGNADLVGFSADESRRTFRIPFERAELPPGTTREFELVYAPPVDNAVVGLTEHEIELTLHLRGTPAPESTATITLRGRAISPACELPRSVDFGWVQTGDTVTHALSICNDTQVETEAFIGAIQSPVGEEQSFRLSDASAMGSVTLPPGRCTEAGIEFSPTQSKTYVSTVEMQVSAQCPRLPVELTGRGVGGALRWRVENREQCQHRDAAGRCQDSGLDCGAVILNTESVERVIHFENHGTANVTLTDLAFQAHHAVFSLQSATGEIPTHLLVPSREAGNAGPGEAALTVLCRPQAIGKVGSMLTGRTSSSSQGRFGILAMVIGGGPKIETSPTSLVDFGPVAHFPDAEPPTFQERRLRIRNAGMGVPGSGLAAHLRLGQADDKGAPTGPHFEIIPGPNTAAGEFTILARWGPSRTRPACG